MFAATLLKSKLAAFLLVSAVGSACTLDTTATVGPYSPYTTDLGYVPTQATYGPGYSQAYTPAPTGSYTPTQYAPNPYTPAPTQYQTYTPQDQTNYDQAAIPLLNEQQLDQLTAPIALYPDPLIAEILPASTYPDELAAAANLMQNNPSEDQIQSQPWDPSIKALAHTPSVLSWMNDNPDWTRTLGTAFMYQSQDVMNSIQRLREQAVAAGSLYNTPQQVVVTEGNNICVEPATPDVIYVPVYDWNLAYTRRYEPRFYVGARLGAWFDNDFDWGDRRITVGAQWDRGWDHRWDHDRDSRVVHTVIRNNDRAGEQRRAEAPHDVRVGVTPWKRDESRPRPTLPSNVTPASRYPVSGRQLGTVKIPDASSLPQERNASRAPAPKAPPTEHRAFNARQNTSEHQDFPRDTSRITQPQRNDHNDGNAPRFNEPQREAQPSREAQPPRVMVTPPANRSAPRVETPARVAAPSSNSGNRFGSAQGPRLGTTPLPRESAPAERPAQREAAPREAVPAPANQGRVITDGGHGSNGNADSGRVITH